MCKPIINLSGVRIYDSLRSTVGIQWWKLCLVCNINRSVVVIVVIVVVVIIVIVVVDDIDGHVDDRYNERHESY